MHADFYRIEDNERTEDNDRTYLDYDVGLVNIRGRFFKKTPKDLFDTLVSTPQKLENILYRQAIFRDFISQVDVGDLLKIKDSLKELASQHNASVKHWKTVREYGCEEKVPLIYDHRRLEEITENLSRISESTVEILSGAESVALVTLREYFAQFTNSGSDVYKQWQEDRVILAQEGNPFFGLVVHDSWSNEIDSIIPLGLMPNSIEINKAIKDAVERGIQKATIVIDEKEYPINLTDHHFMFKEKSHRVSHPRKKYCEYDLFGNVFDIISESISQLYQLHFFQDGMEMYTYFTKAGLPMCLPQLSDSDRLVFDIEDFYPFFEDLKPSEYVLNSLRLDNNHPVTLVTGLNSGGKSTLLRSFGCIVSMARSGLPVPAKSANLANVENVIYQESVRGVYEDGLSTFRNQTRTLSGLITDLPKRPKYLLLLNEPLPGTDYETETEGMLDSLRALAQLYHVPTLVESHCISAGYAIQGDETKYSGIRLVKFQMDPRTDKPDYILREGVGRSEGSYVLKEEGLTFNQLQRAFKKKK